jgi:hypothetical protein
MVKRGSTALFVLMALGGCGGGSGSTPTGPTGPQTETFSGSAQLSATGGCSNVGHPFNSGEGTVAITLVESSGSVPVAVQVCHPTATAHDSQCTVPPFARVAVGMSVRVPLKGGRAQVLTIYPEACGRTGTPTATSITYTVTVEHPR